MVFGLVEGAFSWRFATYLRIKCIGQALEYKGVSGSGDYELAAKTLALLN
jgi:hypothetical protein